MTLKHPVRRMIAGGCAIFVEAERVQWVGIPLMLHHVEDHNGHIKMTDAWACSHEPSGYLIGKGPSPETALAVAIEKIRRNWDEFHAQIQKLPVINR